MTVKQSETESFKPEPPGDVLDASLDALIAGADSAKPHDLSLSSGSGTGNTPRPMPAGNTPRPLAAAGHTPKPAATSDTPRPAPSPAQTLLGIGTLGLPLPPARNGFPLFPRKPAADDTSAVEGSADDTGDRAPVQLPDPLTAQAAAHRDRALGRVPGLSAQPETPPPPAARAENDGLGAVPAEVVDTASGRAEVRSSDVEFESPDDGPTSLNPEIGEALSDADFFSASSAQARLPEPIPPLLPTGAPRLPSGQYPRLVSSTGDDTPGDTTGFNLTLPPPRSRTTGSMTAISNSSMSFPAMGLSTLQGMAGAAGAAVQSARASLVKSRLTTFAAFAACFLAGVIIDKAFLHRSPEKTLTPVATPAPHPAPTPPAITPMPPTVAPLPPAVAPIPPPAAPTVVAAPAPTPPPAAHQEAAPGAVPASPPAGAAVATPTPSRPRKEPAADSAAPRTGTEPVSARAAVSSRPATGAKPATKPPARPKTKWVDPFAP